MSARVLYISYDGLLEPLGNSQVLQYLKGLAQAHEIHLVTFEKPEDWSDVARRIALQDEVGAAGIRWVPLQYHRSPSLPATAYDILNGFRVAAWIAMRRRIHLVHARSYVPALIALLLKQWTGLRFLFDMRGFWPDEKVDAGTWARDSAVYRWSKTLERKALLSADAVVSLTHAGVQVMRGFEYLQHRDVWFEVISTCANLDRFRPQAAEASPQAEAFRLGYVGNVEGWYLFDPVVMAFEAIRAQEPSARLEIVNRGQHGTIRQLLSERGIPEGVYNVKALEFYDVPAAVGRMDAAAFFIRPTLSKLASAPTKLAEFLGCGVPCMVNGGVGDMGKIVREEGVGIVLDTVEPAAVAEGALGLRELARDPAVRDRCVRVARKYFSLQSGVGAYDRIYRTLLSDPVRSHRVVH